MHDSQGNFFSLEAAKQDMAYNEDGTLASITATLGNVVWVQDFTYVNGNISAIGQWERQ